MAPVFGPEGCDVPCLDEADESCHDALDWTARDSESCLIIVDAMA